MASFQERLRAARAAAFAKDRPEKVITPKVAKPKAVVEKQDIAKRVREIARVRKEKKTTDDIGPKPEVDYTPRSRAGSRDKRLPDRDLNLQNKIKVQVNRNTWVYADPGYDLEELKAKYNPKTKVSFDDKITLKYQG